MFFHVFVCVTFQDPDLTRMICHSDHEREIIRIAAFGLHGNTYVPETGEDN